VIVESAYGGSPCQTLTSAVFKQVRNETGREKKLSKGGREIGKRIKEIIGEKI
jgi:hypothetical protein